MAGPLPAFALPSQSSVSEALGFVKETQGSGRALVLSHLLPKAGKELTRLWEREDSRTLSKPLGHILDHPVIDAHVRQNS